jgi:pilus assembly protein Flp/PilA
MAWKARWPPMTARSGWHLRPVSRRHENAAWRMQTEDVTVLFPTSKKFEIHYARDSSRCARFKLSLKFECPVFSDPGKNQSKTVRYIRPDFEKGSLMILQKFLKDESGATAIEYGLIAALIAVVIITGITAVGTQLSATFTNLATTLR